MRDVQDRELQAGCAGRRSGQGSPAGSRRRASRPARRPAAPAALPPARARSRRAGAVRPRARADRRHGTSRPGSAAPARAAGRLSAIVARRSGLVQRQRALQVVADRVHRIQRRERVLEDHLHLALVVPEVPRATGRSRSPSSRIAPPVGRSWPASSCAMVLLPEPLSPTSATTGRGAGPANALDRCRRCRAPAKRSPCADRRASSTSGPGSPPRGNSMASTRLVTAPRPAGRPRRNGLGRRRQAGRHERAGASGGGSRAGRRAASDMSTSQAGSLRRTARGERAARRQARAGRAGEPGIPVSCTRGPRSVGTSSAARACTGAAPRADRGSARRLDHLPGVHHHDLVGDLE